MCMDTITNVPDMRRKEKQRVRGVGVVVGGQEGQTPPKGDGVCVSRLQ